MIIKFERMINDEDWKTFAAKFSIELNLIWIDNINLKYYSFLLFVYWFNKK